MKKKTTRVNIYFKFFLKLILEVNRLLTYISAFEWTLIILRVLKQYLKKSSCFGISDLCYQEANQHNFKTKSKINKGY